MALWKINDDMNDLPAQVSSFITTPVSTVPIFEYKIGSPTEVKFCKGADKIRALAYNKQATVSIYRLHTYLFVKSKLIMIVL